MEYRGYLLEVEREFDEEDAPVFNGRVSKNGVTMLNLESYYCKEDLLDDAKSWVDDMLEGEDAI